MIEVTLIGGLVAIVSFEYFAWFWHEIVAAFKENPRGVAKYLGSAAVFWLTMALLPTLLLSIYMRHHGFFAYEAFDANRLAFQMLSLNVLFNLAVVTLLFLAFVLPAGQRWPRTLKVVLGSMGALLALALFNAGSRASVAILTFCLLLVGYLYFTLSRTFAQKAAKWGIPLVFAAVYVYLPIVFHPWAAAFVANQLYQLRVGAIDVEILEQPWAGKPGVATPARLVLRTSEFYYLKLKSDPRNLLIVKADSVVIRYLPEQVFTVENDEAAQLPANALMPGDPVWPEAGISAHGVARLARLTHPGIWLSAYPVPAN